MKAVWTPHQTTKEEQYVETMLKQGGIHHQKRKSTLIASVLIASLASNLVLVGLLYAYPSCQRQITTQAVKFHGGHPVRTMKGSCYCSGEDTYCMCNPSLAIDLIILSGTDHIWLVRRKDTNQLAVMGGFVDVGESVEDAVKRELREETGLVLPATPKLLGIYSDPRRDNRRHSASAAFVIQLDGSERPVASDDVREVERLPLSEIGRKDFFSDHKTIINDYLKKTRGQTSANDFLQSEGDFAPDIQRNICLS
jgi:8-oxo-dGTP diphosphatase